MNPNDLWSQVDPAWCWEPWTPSEDNPWNQQAALHLYRRAGFGATPKNLALANQSTFQTTLDSFFPQSVDAEYERESSDLTKAILAGGNLRQLPVGWLHRMLNSPHPLVEKMTLFWHGHFATGADKVNDIFAMQQQNQTLRASALGSFADLVRAISKDPAMLVYLDSAYNRKAHPNENYARELMELFCMGEGNYTEKDVQELARCFTGWEIRRLQFRFNPYQHDSGSKQILGSGPIESGEEAIEIILAHPATPRFLALKLFRFFIADEPSPSDGLIEPLAEQLRRDNLQVGQTVRKILGSNLMFSSFARNRKIRSPIEWLLGWMQALEITGNLQQISESLGQMGQQLYYPPNVKGWDGGRSWINSSTLVARANALHRLIRDENTRFGKKKLVDYAKSISVDSPERWLGHIIETCLGVGIPDMQREELLKSVESYPAAERLREILSRVAMWPQTHIA